MKDPIIGGLKSTFAIAEQPASGYAVSGYHFLHEVANLAGAGKVPVAITEYKSAGIDASRHIEIAGKLPRAALKGLRRVRFHEDAPALGWRNGVCCNAPLFALDSVGQLVDLLAAAGEVRQ